MPRPSGAFTGDLSAEMLADAGATYVLVGHSERRQYHGEKDADVSRQGRGRPPGRAVAIVCVGETREEREAGKTLGVVRRQLARLDPGRRRRPTTSWSPMSPSGPSAPA